MFTRLLLRIGAFLIVVLGIQTFGSEVEYISKPELDGFKSTECSQDCMLHGMLGGRLVQLRRDQDGASQLQLVPDDSILDALVTSGSLQREDSKTALSIVIEHWDKELLAHLDTRPCVQDCSLLIQLQNSNALVVRGAEGNSRLVWPTNIDELLNERVQDQSSVLSTSQTFNQSGDDPANCAGDGAKFMQSDPSKTLRSVLSFHCYPLLSKEEGIVETQIKRTIEHRFFNCEGAPNRIDVETFEYENALDPGDSWISACPPGSIP